jgi:peptide/nickel transport system permease protein
VLTFIGRRLAQAIIVLIGVSVVTFILLHLLPGGPARGLLGAHANAVQIQTFDQTYGLLKPLPEQYFAWVWQLLHGNLGFSYQRDESVDTLLAQNIPRTLFLAGTATLLALMVAVPLGVYQAARANHADDHLITGVSLAFYATPTFFLGIILIVLFTQEIKILPPTGPSSSAPVWDQLSNLVLPVVTLTLVTLALFTRYMRASTIDALLQDYIRTARAKGASHRRILIVHASRNSLLPVITLVGLSVPGILSGALVVESLFDYPGMGLLFWNAAQTQDYPVLLGSTLVVGCAVVLGSLLADVLYAVANPRIRYT